MAAPSSTKFVVGKVEDMKDGDRLLANVGGREVVVFRQDGEFFAMLNRCPHRGADLHRGRFQRQLKAEQVGEIEFNGTEEFLACPWHGWEFDIRTGQSYFDPTGVRVRPYPVSVEGGDEVKVALESGEVVVTDRADYTPAEWAAAVPHLPEGRQPGPYQVETFDVSVEDEFLVVSSRPARPARRASADEATTEN